MILCKRSPLVSGDQRSIHRRPGLKNLFLSLLLLSAPALLQAHEGHDHEEPTPASSVATSTVKRATAQSELFEIVAVPNSSNSSFIWIDLRITRLSQAQQLNWKVMAGKAQRKKAARGFTPLPPLFWQKRAVTAFCLP